MLAFEHHKPRLSIREKECAVNYLVSFLRPYDEDLMGVIEEVTVSTKEQINDELVSKLLFMYSISFCVAGQRDD